jgi:hypothetical protein
MHRRSRATGVCAGRLVYPGADSPATITHVTAAQRSVARSEEPERLPPRASPSEVSARGWLFGNDPASVCPRRLLRTNRRDLQLQSRRHASATRRYRQRPGPQAEAPGHRSDHRTGGRRRPGPGAASAVAAGCPAPSPIMQGRTGEILLRRRGHSAQRLAGVLAGFPQRCTGPVRGAFDHVRAHLFPRLPAPFAPPGTFSRPHRALASPAVPQRASGLTSASAASQSATGSPPAKWRFSARR